MKNHSYLDQEFRRPAQILANRLIAISAESKDHMDMLPLLRAALDLAEQLAIDHQGNARPDEYAEEFAGSILSYIREAQSLLPDAERTYTDYLGSDEYLERHLR